MSFLIAICFDVVGLCLLYAAWRKKGAKHLSIVGWGLILTSFVFWRQFGGPDRGIALGLIAFILAALLLIGIEALRTPGKAKPAPVKPANPNTQPLRLLGRTGLFLWIFLGGGLIAFAIAIGLHQLLFMAGFEPANTIVFELFLFPILWAVVSMMLLMRREARKAV